VNFFSATSSAYRRRATFLAAFFNAADTRGADAFGVDGSLGSDGTVAKIFDIAIASNARIVVLVTFPALTTLSIAPIIVSSLGASTIATMS
jgi:hypothetical protein